MTKIIIFICLLAAVLVAQVSSHATMIFPLSRGSAWRTSDNTFPVVYQDDHDYCAFPRKPFVKCGICGPIYNNDVSASEQIAFKQPNGHFYNETHYSFEKGGPYYTGMIANHFTKGQVVDTLISVNAGHKGHFEFRVCNADGIENPDDSCFEVLSSTDGRTTFDQIVRSKLTSDEKEFKKLRDFDHATQKLTDFDQRTLLYKFNIQLPADLTCDHCIFQWRWLETASSQDYVSCSDISIA